MAINKGCKPTRAQPAGLRLDATNVVTHRPECDDCLDRQAQHHHRQTDYEVAKNHVMFSGGEVWNSVARALRQRSSSQIVPQA